LLEQGVRLRVHDPQATETSMREIPPEAGRLEYCSSPYEAARGAHALLVLSPWQEYRELNWIHLPNVMEVPVVIDGRNFLDPDVVCSAGFEYWDMGRHTCKRPQTFDEAQSTQVSLVTQSTFDVPDEDRPVSLTVPPSI
jgi:hypothetical protein